MRPAPQPSWNLTPQAFDRLLDRLGPDRDRAAQEYERLHRRLCDFFDWRGSSCPDVHADETLDRVARKLVEGEAVERLASYAYGVARRVLLDWDKRRVREQAALEELQSAAAVGDPAVEAEREFTCLERCLGELSEDSRTLIVAYYREAAVAPLEARKLLAGRLGIAYGALKTRAHRVRARLEQCVRGCLQPQSSGNR